MIKILFTLLICLSFPLQEANNAYVTFKVSHLGVLTVEGKFDNISINLSRISVNQWRAKGAVNASSVNTGNSSRDETILSEQYLHLKEYPTIPFEVEIIKNEQLFLLNLEIKLRGIPVVLQSELKVVEDQLTSQSIIIDRKEIGLDFGTMDGLIGDEIEIVIHTQLSVSDLTEMRK